MKFVRPDNRNAREPLTASPSRPGLGNHYDWRARQDGWTRRELLAFSLSLFTQELGVPVLPDWGVRDLNVCECREKGACRNIGKHPALKHVTDATTNLEDAYEWWRKWDHNFAAIPVGYVVIDIDHGNVGLNEFFDWCLVNGLNPERMITETLSVQSGSGGWHLWYRRSAGDPPLAPHNHWLPHVDFKTADQRACKSTLPGSLHKSLNRYEFANLAEPLPAPSVLLDALRTGLGYDEQTNRFLSVKEDSEAITKWEDVDPAYEYGGSIPREFVQQLDDIWSRGRDK